MDEATTKRRKAILLVLSASPEREDGWHDLYMEFWPFVYGIIYHRLDGNSHTEEVTDEVFRRLAKYRPFKQLTDPDAFQRYLGRMVMNAIRDAVRHDYRLLFVGGSEEFDIEDPNSPRPDHPSAEVSDARTFILGARSSLSDADQKLLDLLVEAQTIEQIAEALKITYRNAGVRIHRLKRKLRLLLSKT